MASAARNYRRAIVDSIAIVVVLAVLYVVIEDLDLFERLARLVAEREDLELDELIILALLALQTLGDTGLSPRRLELEISESAMVGDIVSAKKALAAFHDAGVRIALDDFGTGNSSLNHLRQCRFDRIKIDRSFVHSMADSAEDASFVSAIVGLSRALAIPVTAEGIESDRVVGALIAEGCSEGQGFNFAAALPAEEALGLLAERSLLRSAG